MLLISSQEFTIGTIADNHFNFYPILFTSIILLCVNGCHPEDENCHRYIHFTNNSGKDVYYSIRIFDEIGGDNPVTAPEYYKIPKNSNTKLSNNPQLDCFEWDERHYLFLFDTQVVENTPWETVRKDNIYLKRYALTIDELNEMNWRIVYEGN